jgi:hypothetical protein
MASDWVSGRKERYATKVGASMVGCLWCLKGERRGFVLFRYCYWEVSIFFGLDA